MVRRTTPRSPAGPPATRAEGAEALRQFAIQLYDRHDGEGVNWRVIAEALSAAAFDVLDRLPDEVCRSVARRFHEGAYERVANGPKVKADAPELGAGAMSSGPDAWKGSRPRPPR